MNATTRPSFRTLFGTLGIAALLVPALVGCATSDTGAAPDAGSTTEVSTTVTAVTGPPQTATDSAGSSDAPTSGSQVPTTAPPGSTVPDPTTGSTSVTTEPPTLDGRQFTVAEDELQTLVVRFDNGQVNLSGGCNQMNGAVEYSIEESAEGGNLLTVPKSTWTRMGCAQEKMDQDALVAELLANQVGWTDNGDGTVTLIYSPVGELTLVETTTDDGDALVGPTWTLDSLISGDSVRPVPGEVQAWITLPGDGTISFSDGCNGGGGDVTIDGDQLVFTNVISTLIGCSGDAGEVSSLLLEVLSTDDPVIFNIINDRLTIMRGDLGVEFVQRTPLTGGTSIDPGASFTEPTFN